MVGNSEKLSRMVKILSIKRIRPRSTQIWERLDDSERMVSMLSQIERVWKHTIGRVIDNDGLALYKDASKHIKWSWYQNAQWYGRCVKGFRVYWQIALEKSRYYSHCLIRKNGRMHTPPQSMAFKMYPRDLVPNLGLVIVERNQTVSQLQKT